MKEFHPIGFIGAGNMAQALIAGMMGKGISPHRIYASDSDSKKLRHLKRNLRIQTLGSNLQLAQKCRVVVLATKPQDLKEVLQEISPVIRNQWILSIAAGVDTETLSKNLRSKNKIASPKIIRAMPNNPALIGEGITALFSKTSLSPGKRKSLEEVFNGAGEVLWVKKEKDLDAVTGLSGSGPAYLYRFVEALGLAGEKTGLSKEISHRLALKTVLGSALTLQKTGKKPSELIPLVTSKKGTTLAGLKVLDQKGFHRLIALTVQAATRRAGEIRKELKK